MTDGKRIKDQPTEKTKKTRTAVTDEKLDMNKSTGQKAENGQHIILSLVPVQTNMRLNRDIPGVFTLTGNTRYVRF